MKTKRLTPLAKILMSIVFFAILIGAVYKLTGFDVKPKKLSTKKVDELYKKASSIKKEKDTINISLDEWIGWKPIIDANGGFTTKKGSIYDKLGVKLNISIINDGSQSSNALIKKELDGAGYTVNRFAFLYPKFIENNTPVKMVYVTNSSTGGDGIIAKKGINKIEDLATKKIAVPRFSEAQTLVEWLISKSSLNKEQIASIRKNMVMFDTPDDAAKAFFSGQVDAAATWQPYLTQAEQGTDSNLLFSTKNATNIILDGIIFREDFLKKNPESVKKLIEGAIKAHSLYNEDLETIQDTFPMFATTEQDEIKSMLGDAQITNCKSNINLLSNCGSARNLFKDMSNIWSSIGEKSLSDKVNDAFTEEYVKALSSKFPNEKIQTVTFTAKDRKTAQKEDNKNALLTQRLSINFEFDSASIAPDSYKLLNNFADTAKILNGAILQIEGNTDNVGDPTYNKGLSLKRAKAISFYLQGQGLDPTRFIVVGNGSDKPLVKNDTEANKAKNRRTDIYFKVVK